MTTVRLTGNGAWRTSRASQRVETADAADPPADFPFAKAGTPAAAKVRLRTVVARRSRLNGGLADSQGRGGVAATAETHLAVRRNGAGTGTIRFAASAGRLAADLETVEEAKDVQRQMLDAAARRPRDRYELACLNHAWPVDVCSL